jgi:hypothetical protein
MTTSEPPTITLILKGLFLLAFEKENKFCQAGVIRADRHCLKINIKANGVLLPISPEILPDGDIFFQVSGRASSVDTYEPGTFDRNTAQDWRDFRWLLDFEGKELYKARLPFKAGALKRSIFIHNGLFYTHSAEPVSLINPSGRRKNIIIADSIGCDIYLDDQEEAVLRYGPHPGSSIKLIKETGISYEISLENFCNEPPRTTPDNSDFVFYYDVIDVPENLQFRLARQGADARNPCSPTTVLKSDAPIS